MSELVPLRDERAGLVSQLIEVFEVRRLEALAPKDREPLLDLIHPGAVNRREVEGETRVLGQPALNALALVNADVVADDMDALDSSRSSAIDLGQKGDHFLLSLSSMQLAEDMPRLDIESGEEVPRAFPLVLVLDPNRDQVRTRWLCLGRARSRLDRGQLVEGEDPLSGVPLARVEIEQVEHDSSEGLIARHLGTQPMMHAPGLQPR